MLQAIEERDKDGKLLRTRFFDGNGNSVKRWGWHKLRHSLALAGSSGVDVKTVSSLLRHSNVRTTLGIYSHAVDSNKLAAQGQFLDRLLANGAVQYRNEKRNGSDTEEKSEGSKWKKRNGRHEETRTPDLYRVKTPLFSITNNLQDYRGLPSTSKYALDDHIAG